ncbi:MAG TPA: 4-(cytidine 5'-diphospho)-2-C-methyl-D-erythritol kinase [Candidatus Binatia bacterium]|nr:4-(cytidine 5'-diphospho)-2-C-methyl-D-erythritol kinase [Candidatus Binatia bacterium]
MPATLTKQSRCKVNLLLNILGKRADGFHELETVMYPLNLFDRLTFKQGGNSLRLTCTDPSLAVDETNLVHRAAAAFFKTTGIQDGVEIHLEKHIPLAAGLGGGSGNAATTLLGLNELFGGPLPTGRLGELAATLGSDVPFFLQDKPAIATGRGEKVQPLDSFPALRGSAFLLVHPGFGVPTAWAYQQLARFPDALNGRVGRAEKLVQLLRKSDAQNAASEFYNSLELPVFEKYPLLAVGRDFLREQGATVALMSGSGSTVFGIYPSGAHGKKAEGAVRDKFGPSWTAVIEA